MNKPCDKYRRLCISCAEALGLQVDPKRDKKIPTIKCSKCKQIRTGLHCEKYKNKGSK